MLYPVLFDGGYREGAYTGHVGYLAGRYRDGAYSDLWTDVSRCAEATFVGYAPACSCGWRGAAHPAIDVGRVRCRREWVAGHLGVLRGPGPTAAPSASRRVVAARPG